MVERTGLGRRVRHLLVDSPNSMGARARDRRWTYIQTAFPRLSAYSIVDLGGTAEWWRRTPVRPKHVTVLNLTEPGDAREDWITPVLGDACQASEVLGSIGAGCTFDMVFSNSLIEHVGGHVNRALLADQVHRLAPEHWVQTPYRYFPLEPHWLFPGMQFLPLRLKQAVGQRWPLTHSRPASKEAALTAVLWTELVSLTEFRALFPESLIFKERAGGLVKSIAAVGSAAAAHS
jgi:hypothetical protein